MPPLPRWVAMGAACRVVHLHPCCTHTRTRAIGRGTPRPSQRALCYLCAEQLGTARQLWQLMPPSARPSPPSDTGHIDHGRCRGRATGQGVRRAQTPRRQRSVVRETQRGCAHPQPLPGFHTHPRLSLDTRATQWPWLCRLDRPTGHHRACCARTPAHRCAPSVQCCF